MASLCSAHQDASNDMYADLEVTLRSRDPRSTIDLIKSSYIFSNAYQREKLNGAFWLQLD